MQVAKMILSFVSEMFPPILMMIAAFYLPLKFAAMFFADMPH